MQVMLFRGWLASAEKNLFTFFPPRQPYCLVAIENGELLAFVVAKPFNRRSTCWSLTLPQFISEPKSCSIRYVRQSLLQSALKLGIKRAQSWTIRCPANDSEQLALARELGFQPLKLFKCWSISSKNDLEERQASKQVLPISHELEWQKINKVNAPLLWPLEQASESGHLRQILDRQWTDLLDQNQEGSGVLICKGKKPNIAIAGLISRPGNHGEKILELLRDIAWDQRITSATEIILRNLQKSSNEIIIETASEDEPINKIINEIGCETVGEKMLLGRSLWKRQLTNNLVPGTRSLESMLGSLQPQNPPLPSPCDTSI